MQELKSSAALQLRPADFVLGVAPWGPSLRRGPLHVINMRVGRAPPREVWLAHCWCADETAYPAGQSALDPGPWG